MRMENIYAKLICCEELRSYAYLLISLLSRGMCRNVVPHTKLISSNLGIPSTSTVSKNPSSASSSKVKF